MKKVHCSALEKTSFANKELCDNFVELVLLFTKYIRIEIEPAKCEHQCRCK